VGHVVATAALIVASVALAIATLRGYTRVFLGPPARSVAPDLLGRERVVVVGVIALLLVLGIVPRLIIGGLAGGDQPHTIASRTSDGK